MSPVLHMGGNNTISKLCTPCMFEVEVYINFGCTAHRELKAFMMGAHSSVTLFEFFMTLSAVEGHCIHVSTPWFYPFSAPQMNMSNGRKLTHWS